MDFLDLVQMPSDDAYWLPCISSSAHPGLLHYLMPAPASIVNFDGYYNWLDARCRLRIRP
jgi:hypothetical protein